jgi:hypothetical protein
MLAAWRLPVQLCWLRALAAAVLLLAVCTARSAAQDTPPVPQPPVPQGEPTPLAGAPTLEDALAGALIVADDVPAELQRQPRMSGRVVVPGLSGHLVTFVRPEAEDAPDLWELDDLPPGTLLLVKNSVQVLTREALTPEVLDTVIRGAEAAASGAGALIDTTTDYGVLPLGDESRAHSMRYHLPGLPSVASTVVAFRRGEVVAALNVEAAGDAPPFEQALRLAQIVDGRLAAITAADATPAPATPTSGPR